MFRVHLKPANVFTRNPALDVVASARRFNHSNLVLDSGGVARMLRVEIVECYWSIYFRYRHGNRVDYTFVSVMRAGLAVLDFANSIISINLAFLTLRKLTLAQV